MTTVNRYQIYCQTEAIWVTSWGTVPISTCPNNTGHTVTSNSVSIIDTVSESTVSYRNSGQVDGYGRLRVSNPRNLFAFDQSYQVGSTVKFVNRITGSGSVTYSGTNNNTTLSCTTNATDSAVFQSRDYFIYQSGTSTLVLFTAVIGAQKTNCNKYIGYFDDNDGLYFTMNGSTGINIGYRSSVSGSIVNTLVPRSSWNGDKCDGTGSSGLNLDYSKVGFWYIDFQWQGGGRVRWGFYSNGSPVIMHQIDFVNTLTVPYLKTPNLPIRFEIDNTGTTASTTSMIAMCVGLSLETLTDPTGLNHSRFTTNDPTPALNILTPIMSIRMRTTFESKTTRMKIVFSETGLISTNANNVYSYSIIWGGTLTGASWSNQNTTYSCMEWDQNATVVTGGVVTKTGLFNSSNSVIDSSRNYLDFNDYPMGLDVDGANPPIITLAVTRINGGGSVVYGSMQWEEIY